MLSRCFLDFAVGVGAFVIGLSQISSFFSYMTKTLTTTENSKKQSDNTKTIPKDFDYTMIADRRRTVNWSNNSHQTCVIKPVYGILNFQLATKAFNQKEASLKIILLIKTEDQQQTKAERP